ncbi:MAG: DUF2807 domain-containing protein [Alphaproteobacteria bacterium]|nr:DUF2807 domain-containing protein [Alphaproteobacteria bacterium]
MSLRSLGATVCVLPLIIAAAVAATPVSVGAFKSVHLNGGGHVVLHHGAKQQVTLLKGSTQFTRFEIRDGDTLVIDVCTADCPHNYQLEVDITAPNIEGAAINGGGEIEAQGTFPNQGHLNVAVSGGGEIDVRSIPADAVNAAINGGGEIRTSPRRTLQAAVNGGGEITYTGNPNVTSAVMGGGDVTKK